MRKLEEIKAVIQKVISEGDHGPFAVATSESIDGSITFSLELTVWQEDEWPEQGVIVVLGNLRKKRADWRAKSGRFLKPSDEQTEIRHQERRKKMKEEQELRERLIKQAIYQGLPARAEEAAQLAGRKLTQKEIDKIIEDCLGRLWTPHRPIESAIEAAKLGTSEYMLNKIINACIKRGWLEEANKAAEVRGHAGHAGYALTKEELLKIVKYYIKSDGRPDALEKAARLLKKIEGTEKESWVLE